MKVNYKKKAKELQEYLLNLYKDLEFDEGKHLYTAKKSLLTSCTTYNSRFSKFDAKAKAGELAERDGGTKEELLAKWKSIGDIASKNGTGLHNDIEYKILDNKYKYQSNYKKIIPKFMKWLKANYEPIQPELRMYMLEVGLAGTSDLPCINKNDGGLAIIDYKTGKPIVRNPTYICKYTGILRESKFKLESPFDDLPQSNFWKYSIQLSEYRYILKHTAGLEFNELKLIHFTTDEFTVHDAEIIDMTRVFNK